MAKWDAFFREKKWKNMKKSDWIVLALGGVLLLILAMPVSERKNTDASKATDTVTQVAETQEETAEEAYTLYLERKLANLLGKMDGAGKVKVMVTLSDAGENVVEKDTNRQDNEVGEQDASGGSRTTTEKREESTTVYVENGSDSYPYVNRKILPTVEGVVVVAEGGDNPTVVSNISDMVMALFRVEAHKIKVVKMNPGEE